MQPHITSLLERTYIIIGVLYLVLPTAGMGSVHRPSGAQVFRLGTNRQRSESSLLRLSLLQRNCLHNTEQTGRRGGGESHTRRSDRGQWSTGHYTSQYYVCAQMPGADFATGVYRDISRELFNGKKLAV